MAIPSLQFTNFSLLPTEIRLKIWRLTLPNRIVEIQLSISPPTNPLDAGGSSELDLDLRPLTRPSLPVTFHICRESRSEALSLYRPCTAATFASPHQYPFNLWNPDRDCLFIPISLYNISASQSRNMFSAAAALSLGTPREFILDRLASADPDEVASVKYLAIGWVDMHVKDLATLVQALEPFRSLRELSLVFFEMRNDRQDIRSLTTERGRCRARLVEPGDGVVRGRYLERVMEEFVELAGVLNEGFREVESLDGEWRKLPEVKIQLIRFEP